MARWTCPACDRQFGRSHQSHACVPAGSVADCFASRPPVQRQIYEAVIGHIKTLGPVHVDAVQVGVFLKRGSKLAELRPKSKWLSLELVLPRLLVNARVSRTVRISSTRFVHVVKLAAVDDVDDELRDWLTEAYLHAT
jgi:hypothetical protein